ncbi:TonB-dependent receptor, partial [candidate division KSB1 bacterium]|nr:TonB-dependent receptor [candidate division KSB1 bacterium]
MKSIIKSMKIFFIFSLFFSFTIANAMPGDGSIKGKVIDKKTKEPLPGVNVIVEHTTVGAATDKNGDFVITHVSTGQLHLVASMMGYKREHKIIHIQPDETTVVNFELEATILEMGAVVVTGTATPHLVEDMPVRTEVIPRRLIEQKHACNLAEALSFHTGIRVENNCQNCNFSQVRILGLDGKYSQILIDGDPVVSSLASVYGLEHFPEEMVDQIEIVKGGGSSLYGGGAIAGVINMITRTPMINQVRIKYQNNSTDGKIDQHLGAVAETVFKKGTSGAYVFGSFRKRNPYDQNNDGFSELGEIRNESMGFKWYYQPFVNSELLASFHQIHEERRGGNKFDLPVHEAEIAEWIEHWRSGGTLRWSHRPGALFDYRFYYSFSIENRKSYYGGLGGDTPQDRLDALAFYGKTDNPLHIAGFQSNYRIENHLLTAGIQYSHDKLKDKTAAETAYHLDELYTNSGVFIQDNLHFGDEEQLEFVAGVRFDKHSELSDWILSPRLNGKFDLGKGITLRAAYTTGFKPPQTYDEDLHLCGIEGDQRIIRNSANLKEEQSYSFSSGLEYLGYLNDIPTMFSLTAFYTRLTDSFIERFVSKQGNIERWERVNSDGAMVKGVEIDLGIRPLSGFEVRGGLTYQRSQYDSPHEDFGTHNFFRTPALTGNIRLSLITSINIDIYLHGTYIGKADVPHEVVVKEQEDPLLLLEKSDKFFQTDVGLTYKLPLNNGLNTKFNIGIKNIFNAYQDDLDQGPDRDPAYVYGPTRPRTLFFG